MPPTEAPDAVKTEAPTTEKPAGDGSGMRSVKKSSENKTYGRNATMPILAADKYAEVEIPDLNEFNPEDIKLDGTVVACGKRRTGKSWVFRNLMYLMRDTFPAGIVISQTDELNHFWSQYIPQAYIFPKYDPCILDAVFERQKKILNDPSLSEDEAEEKARFFVLLDDVISDSRLKHDSNLMELFVAGRHYKIFTLITTQYAKGISPVLRGNTDYIFIMKTLQMRQRESLWEDFADFLTKDAFAQILDAYTEDNETLVINTCPDTHVDPMEMLGWWKAIDPGEFKMGSVEYWQSAMNGIEDSGVPPPGGAQSASDMLTVKHIMPQPWSQYI
jgi:hypothetical protein